MMCKKMLMLVLVLTLASSAPAALRYWTGGTSSDWTDPANWQFGAGPVPDANDYVDICGGVGWGVVYMPVITTGQTARASTIRMNPGYDTTPRMPISITVNGGTLIVGSNLYIGNVGGDATLTLNSGSIVNNGITELGYRPGSDGVVYVNGGTFTAGDLRMPPTWDAAGPGTGKLYISGGEVDTTYIMIEDGGSVIDFTKLRADGGGKVVNTDWTGNQISIDSYVGTKIVADGNQVQVNYSGIYGQADITEIYGVAPTLPPLLPAGAYLKSPPDHGTETNSWPLWWADGTEGPFDSYDVYLGTSPSAVLAADTSRGPCTGNDFPGDIDGDCSVDFYDLAHLANQWLAAPSSPSADLNNDAFVNLSDYAVVAGNWGDSNPFKGNQTAQTFNLWDLIPGKTYYWSIDAHKEVNLIPGEVWSFNAVPRWQLDKFVIFIGWAEVGFVPIVADKYAYLQRLSDLGINTIMENHHQTQYLSHSNYGIQNMIYDNMTLPWIAELAESDPNVFGYFQSDEPNPSLIPSVADYHWGCHWAAPSKPSYTNIQSINYGVPRSYVDTFIQTVHPEILSFDFYQWYWQSQTLIENLEYFRKQAIANDIPLFSWVEVDAKTTNTTTASYRRRYSVYMNLAYGVKGICWFTAGDIFNTGTGTTGTIKNQTYYNDVQAINRELKNLGPYLVALNSTAVYHANIGGGTKDWTGLADPMNPIPVDNWVQVPDTIPITLGMFTGLPDYEYIMVANRDITNVRSVDITFKDAVNSVEVFDASANTWSSLTISGLYPNQSVTQSLNQGYGKLLRVIKQ